MVQLHIYYVLHRTLLCHLKQGRIWRLVNQKDIYLGKLLWLHFCLIKNQKYSSFLLSKSNYYNVKSILDEFTNCPQYSKVIFFNLIINCFLYILWMTNWSFLTYLCQTIVDQGSIYMMPINQAIWLIYGKNQTDSSESPLSRLRVQ